MQEIVYQAALVPVVMGVVEVFKKAGMPDKFAPVISLLLGIGGAFLFGIDAPVGAVLLQGVVVGLAASGLYSGTRAQVKGE